MRKFINKSEIIQPLCIFYISMSILIILSETCLSGFGYIFFILGFITGLELCIFEGILRYVFDEIGLSEE